MKELGLYLKKRREEKNIPLEEVSVATKIGIKVLQALESGDEERLPPKPFVRGFVLSYARYLGLDTQEILDMFQKSSGGVPPASALTIPESSKKMERGLPGGARNIITVSLIILLIIAIVVVQRIISKREAEMRGEVSAVTGNSEPLNLKAGPSPTASPSTLEGVLPMSVASATAAPSATVTATPTARPTEKPTTTPEPTATATPTAAPKESPSPVAVATPTPAPEPELIPQEVIIEALDKVTLKITVDNKAEKEVTLNPDQIQTFKAKGKIKIYTPDGGAISIIQNGFDLGVPGNLGQPKMMVFPK
jgi:cytoskeleton protein RodZ